LQKPKGKQTCIRLLTRRLAVQIRYVQHTSLTTLRLGIEQAGSTNGASITTVVTVAAVVLPIRSKDLDQTQKKADELHVDVLTDTRDNKIV
jgi:hypothetical protein